jgi:hypothetical protein
LRATQQEKSRQRLQVASAQKAPGRK